MEMNVPKNKAGELCFWFAKLLANYPPAVFGFF